METEEERRRKAAEEEERWRREAAERKEARRRQRALKKQRQREGAAAGMGIAAAGPSFSEPRGKQDQSPPRKPAARNADHTSPARRSSAERNGTPSDSKKHSSSTLGSERSRSRAGSSSSDRSSGGSRTERKHRRSGSSSSSSKDESRSARREKKGDKEGRHRTHKSSKKKRAEKGTPASPPGPSKPKELSSEPSGLMTARQTVGAYVLGKKLGKGAYGVVWRGVHRELGSIVAVKQLNLDGVSKEVMKTLQMEIQLLQALNHPNIVRYIDHYTNTDQKQLNIVMEYVENGSLAQMVRDYGCFPESLCKTYTYKCLHGLVYLHEQGVIHRDIKGGNILITKTGDVKLADFGVSQNMSSKDSQGGADDDAKTPAGTPYYMAPEVIQFLGAVPQSDVWSLGCTIIELLTGDPPYYKMDPFSAMYKMVQEGVPIPKGLTRSLHDFLTQCFQRDSNLRVQAKRLQKHPWLKDVRTNLEGTSAGSADTGSVATATVVEAAKKINELKQMKVKAQEEAKKDIKRIKRMDSVRLGEDNRDFWMSPAKREPHKSSEAQRPSSSIAKSPQSSPRPGGLKLAVGRADSDEEDDPFANIDEDGDMDAAFPDSGDELKLALPSTSDSPRVKTSLGRFVDDERDDDDWGDAFGAGNAQGQGGAEDDEEDDDFAAFDSDDGELVLNFDNLEQRLEERQEEEWEDWDENELFQDDQAYHAALIEQQKREALKGEINTLLDRLRPTTSQPNPEEIETACGQLIELFHKNPDQLRVLITSHCLLTLIRLLTARDETIVVSVLRLILRVLVNEEILVNLCVMGAIPPIMRCSASNHPPIRMGSAFIIQEIVNNPNTLQMFIACCGLPVLVCFLDTSSGARSCDFIKVGINSIHSFFLLSRDIQTHKSEFLRLFIECQLFEKLATALSILMNDSERDLYLFKGLTIIREFSLGDAGVKHAVTSSPLIECMRFVFTQLNSNMEIASVIIRCVRNLAVCEQSILNSLAVFIQPFITFVLPLVKSKKKEQAVKEVQNQVLHILFNLCLLNLKRQEQAVKAGLIPFLLHFVKMNNALMEFAVPMLCDLARSSSSTRAALWSSAGLDFYLSLLDNRNYQMDGLQAIAEWIASPQETARIEAVLIRPVNLRKVIDVFVTSRDSFTETLVQMLESCLKIVAASRAFRVALAQKKNGFLAAMKPSLSNPNLYVRLHLLRLISAMTRDLGNTVLVENNLLGVMQKIAKEDSSVLVRNLARGLRDLN